MVTESVAGGVAFGVTDVAFAMGRRRLRRDRAARVTIKKISAGAGQLRVLNREQQRTKRLERSVGRSQRSLLA